MVSTKEQANLGAAYDSCFPLYASISEAMSK
jgi:hypothetical protein